MRRNTKNILAGMGVATVAGVIMLSQAAFAAQTTTQEQRAHNGNRPVIEKSLKTTKHITVKKPKTPKNKIGKKAVTTTTKS
jgi:hypothetical protein